MAALSTSAAFSVFDIIKCHVALNPTVYTLGEVLSSASLGCAAAKVESDRELMRSDPKSTSQYHQEPEHCNEDKPIRPTFISV